MTPHGSARVAGFVVGATVMSVGLILSLAIGAWGRSLVAATLTYRQVRLKFVLPFGSAR